MKTKRLNTMTILFYIVASMSIANAQIAMDADDGSGALHLPSNSNGKNYSCPANLEASAPPQDAATSDKFYDGSSLFHTCQKLARGHLPRITNMSDANFWEKYAIYDCCQDKNKEKASGPELNKCVTKNLETAKSCEAVAFIIKDYGRDWTDPEQIKKTSAQSGGQAPMGQQNGSAASIASAGSSFKCTSDGIETVDYESCVEFKNKLETINVVQQVGYATQELVYQDKISDSELKHMGNDNVAVGALKTQGDSLKMQGDMYNQRTAVDATKLAYLYSIYNDMPDNKDVLGKCKALKGKDLRGLSNVDKACEISVARGSFSFLMNQKNRDAMKARLIEIAASAGSNAILANLMNKRAGDVDKAIAKIEDYKPVDPYTITEDEALTNYCAVNPSAAACTAGDLSRTFDTIGDNIINFGDGGTGTVYHDRETDPGTNALAQTGGTVDRKSVESVGNVVTPANKDNSIEASTGASVKDGATGSTGGGGGGGTVAGGGGGGGSDGQAAGVANQAVASLGPKPTYEGGGGFSVVGGSGINNKKKSDSADGENPFSKLFGKDNNSSSLVNFREPASMGKKGDNIFDMISKRYTKVSGDKRLLEYELAK